VEKITAAATTHIRTSTTKTVAARYSF